MTAKLSDWKYVMCLRNDSENIMQKVKNEEIAYNVVESVVVFSNNARIKTKYRHHCMSDMMKLWNVWQGLMKNKMATVRPGKQASKLCSTVGHSCRYWCTDAFEDIMKQGRLCQQGRNRMVSTFI